MPYSRESFRGQWGMDRARGDRVYQARQAMGMMVDAQRSGYAQYIFPACGESLDEEYVEGAVKTIDHEWDAERKRRSGGEKYQDGGAHFGDLPALQQQALVELLRGAKYRGDPPTDFLKLWHEKI